ncbi:hypothetical protein A8144_00475 [Mycobacterium leprae 3125609]|uniref:L308_C2_194 n=1 Tax=Mycobacterium leprae TaxID=1769 RepID=Q49906_MYCLR|nr:L308_C2_194 [Mycobacterium leprae]OAR21721.1 hypothetical protein A8144_00475 [Mycobacterium leprae 3125609]OAX72260.1 hypothetical protein A3216_00540 [Mycobacterium leprae 7935681]
MVVGLDSVDLLSTVVAAECAWLVAMIVLERLSLGQWVAFVLHDWCAVRLADVADVFGTSVAATLPLARKAVTAESPQTRSQPQQGDQPADGRNGQW